MISTCKTRWRCRAAEETFDPKAVSAIRYMRPSRNMVQFIAPTFKGSKTKFAKSRGLPEEPHTSQSPGLFDVELQDLPKFSSHKQFLVRESFTGRIACRKHSRCLYRQFSISWICTCTVCRHRTAAAMQASSGVCRTRILTLVSLCLSAWAALAPQRTHRPVLMTVENACLTNG